MCNENNTILTNSCVCVQFATGSMQAEVPCNGNAVPGEHQTMD